MSLPSAKLAVVLSVPPCSTRLLLVPERVLGCDLDHAALDLRRAGIAVGSREDQPSAVGLGEAGDAGELGRDRCRDAGIGGSALADADDGVGSRRQRHKGEWLAIDDVAVDPELHARRSDGRW